MQAAHKFSTIYDRLNGQPHLQELILAPVIDELNTQEDHMFYMQRAVPWQNLNILNLDTIIGNRGRWHLDEYLDSFSEYVLQVMTSADR